MSNKLTALAIGGVLALASGTAAAGSNVSFGISFGFPMYEPAPVYAAPPVAYYRPAPVYYAPRPAYYAPRPFYGPRVAVGYNHGWGRRW